MIPSITTAYCCCYCYGVGRIPMEEVPEISVANLIAFMETIDGNDR